MSGTLLCCGEEGINPLECDRGSWGGEANMPVTSSELQEQEKSPLTSFFLLQHSSPKTGSGLCWLQIIYGPYSDRDVRGPLQRNSRWREERGKEVTGKVKATTVKALLIF